MAGNEHKISVLQVLSQEGVFVCMKLIIKLEVPCIDAIYYNVQSLEGSTKLFLVVACDYFCLHMESFSSITVFYLFFQLGFICYISIRIFYTQIA